MFGESAWRAVVNPSRVTNRQESCFIIVVFELMERFGSRFETNRRSGSHRPIFARTRAGRNRPISASREAASAFSPMREHGVRHNQPTFFPSRIAAVGGDSARKKRTKGPDAQNLGLTPEAICCRHVRGCQTRVGFPMFF